MQIAPLLQSTLNLAGYMAARGCTALARGRAPGVDLGRVRADGSMQVEENAAHFDGALEQGRELLAAPPAGGVAQALVSSQRLQIDGTPLTQALVAECAGLDGALDGVKIALPFQSTLGARPFVVHRARVVGCPEALEPLADELLIAFAQGMASQREGYKAWLEALVLETEAAPRPPADLRDSRALACAIHASDPHADSDAKAAAHLQAFFDRGRFEGGLGFEKMLRTLTLDFTLASLGAVDALLDRLHAERRPQPDAFLRVQAGLNFLHLLAVYLGETLAQAAGATIAWRTHAQLESVEPGRLAGASDAATALVCVFNGHGPGTGLVFLPLDVVACRLFGRADAPTLAQAAAGALAAIRAARQRPALDIGALWAGAESRGEPGIPRPEWLAGDPLERWFDDLPTLWRSGRVVWARLVQANGALFAPGAWDAPGEVVYDDSGRLDAAGLDAVAERLFALRGLHLRNPSLDYLGAYLAHQLTRTRGFPVPASLGARGLRVATLMFHRAHLAGGKLAGRQFPVLVSDAVPGVVAVLPARFWPVELRKMWIG